LGFFSAHSKPSAAPIAWKPNVALRLAFLIVDLTISVSGGEAASDDSNAPMSVVPLSVRG
jgi:hypothetical protein